MSNQLSGKTGCNGALPPSNSGYLSKVLFKTGLLRERRGEREKHEPTPPGSNSERLTHYLEKLLSTENIKSLRKGNLQLTAQLKLGCLCCITLNTF